MKITPITREDLPTVNARENSASTQLFREFQASDADLIKVELDDSDKSVASVRSTLGNYVQRHKLPIKVFTRGGNLYMEKVTAVEADTEADALAGV